MILGDSFVVGAHVSAENTIPGLLQARLGGGYEVFSLAAPGWGIDQMYLAYHRYKEVINPNIVILVFIDDDVKRVLEAYRVSERLNKPSFTVEGGKLVARQRVSRLQLALDRLLANSVLLSLVAREIYLATDAKAVVRQIFLDIGREMETNGRALIVLRIPTADHDHFVAIIRRSIYQFESVSTEKGITYLEAAEVITKVPNWEKTLYVQDGHINASGIELVVDYLFKSLTAQ
jgi:hypothetical protein